VEKCDVSLNELNLPEPKIIDSVSKKFAYEYNWDQSILMETYEHQSEKLTKKQQIMFNKINDSVVNKEGRIFFCDAPGGSGKTFTATTLLAKLRSETRVCLACAASGIAANQLQGGTTAHTKFKIPLELHEDTKCDIREGTSHSKLIQDAELIVLDEATMMHKLALDAIDRTCQEIRGNEKPFGGITVALMGDWCQTLPVVPRASKEQKIASTILYSECWKQVEIIELADNMRAKMAGGDAEFSQHLLDIGEGKVPTYTINGLEYIKIPADMILDGQKPEDLVDNVFHDLNDKYQDRQWLINRAIICPLNDDVNEINEQVMKKLPGNEQQFYSIDRVLDHDLHANVEVINKLKPQGLPLHEIKLKLGCVIMLTRNINAAEGHCNGTRYIVTNMSKHVIEAFIPFGPHKGKVLYIPRIDNRPPKTYSPQMSRLQFPIKVAFAMTSNKSQSQTLQQIGICLQSPFFDHGQFYVAESRCGNRSRIKFFIPHSNTCGSQIQQAKDKRLEYFTSNVVYKEIFALSKK
jgi:ATP-dependent DNA helicase PIF1